MTNLERAKKTAEDIEFLIDKGFGTDGAKEVLEDMRYLFSLLEEKEKDLETAERQRDEAVKALEWYGAEKTYRLGVNITMGAAFPLHEPIKEDKGELARTTLKRIKGGL